MRLVMETLLGQGRAITNARAACTELSRRRVEREEVALFLEQLAVRAESRSA